MNLKQIINALAKSELARQLYAAITNKWGSVGIAVALAIVIIVGVVALGYDLSVVQTWFAGLE